MKITGGCQCGAVRYELGGPLPHAYACHCGDCKKQTSSAFSTAFKMDINALTIVGKLSMCETKAHSGAIKYCWFCGDCGTRMWHSKAKPAAQINLKAGTLDDPSLIRILGHLWVSRKSPGFDIAADAVRHDTQPDDLRGWYVSLAGEKI